jgi:hypothetical protein
MPVRHRLRANHFPWAIHVIMRASSVSQAVLMMHHSLIGSMTLEVMELVVGVDWVVDELVMEEEEVDLGRGIGRSRGANR